MLYFFVSRPYTLSVRVTRVNLYRLDLQEKTKKSRKGNASADAPSNTKAPQVAALTLHEQDADAVDPMDMFDMLNGDDIPVSLAPLEHLPIDGGGGIEHQSQSSSGSSVSADELEVAPSHLFETAVVSLPHDVGFSSGVTVVEHAANEFEHTIDAFIDGAFVARAPYSTLEHVRVH